jgi:hypothetical protein
MRGWGYHNRKKKWGLFLALSTKERWHFAVIFGTYVAFSHHFCLHQNPAVLVGITAIWCNCTVRFDSNSSCDIVTLPHWICFHTLEKWTWASLQQNAYSSEIFISLFDSAWQFIRPTYGSSGAWPLPVSGWKHGRRLRFYVSGGFGSNIQKSYIELIQFLETPSLHHCITTHIAK